MRLWLLVLTMTSISLTEIVAEQRTALVIGNGAYASLGELSNPAEDARLVARTLEGLGFETTLILDSDQGRMKQQIADFGRRLRSMDQNAVGLFYFAGHGVQTGGRNYLIPVEARPTDQADLDLMGVETNWVLRQMESAGNKTNIVILDACRNNPFVSADRSLNQGLAPIDAPTGSFISYATAPGELAMDGEGMNSPFTSALAKALPMPGLPIEQVFKQVRIDVIRMTSGRQTPWDSSSLVDNFYFRDASIETVSETTPVERSLWQSVGRSGDAGRLALFLQVYPNSSFAPEARSLLAEAVARDPALVIGTDDAGLPAGSSSKVAAPAAESVDEAHANTPRPSEHDLISRAQSSGTIEDFQDYLTAYPDGVFVDLVQAEILHFTASRLGNAENSLPQTTFDNGDAGPQFDQPLVSDTNVASPRSLRQLAQAYPAFPPVEGLPSDYWAEQQCSNCHNWTQENLCDQGAFYTAADANALQRIQHPFGGFFKSELRNWANTGCR